MVRPVGSSSIPTPVINNDASPVLTPVANTPQVSRITPSDSVLSGAAEAARSKRDHSADQARKRVEYNPHVDPASILPKELKSINEGLAAEGITPDGMDATNLYRKLLSLNKQQTEPWSDPAMQVVAKINRSNARKIRRENEPASPRTQAVLKKINDDDVLKLALQQGADAATKFRTLLDYDIKEGTNFNKPSMARAVGMNTASINRIINEQSPLSASAAAIKAEVPWVSPPLAFFKAILAYNNVRISDNKPSWSEDDMIKASGARKDNARKAMKELQREGQIAGPSAQPSAVSVTSSVPSMKRSNPSITEDRPAKRQLSQPYRDYVDPRTVDPTEVARISATMRENGLDVDAVTGPVRYEAARHLALEHSTQWSDEAMQVFANVSRSTASRIRKKQDPASPRTMAVKMTIEQDAVLSAELDEQISVAARFQRMMDYQAQHRLNFHAPSVAEAVGMNRTDVSRTLKLSNPLTSAALAIRMEVPEVQPPRKYFRDILAFNERRIASSQPAWLEKDMIAAAKIRRDYAKLVLKENQSSLEAQLPQPVIKSEIDTRFITARLKEVQLDMSRTAFYPELGDLTGEGVSWTTHFDANTKVIVHDMKPNPAMDMVFPIRDPAHPERPHPAYSDDQGNIGQSRVGEVSIGRGFISFLQGLSRAERSKPIGQRRLDLSNSQVRLAINSLQKNVKSELSRTLLNQAQAQPSCTTRQLTASDVLPHERPLIGQHGLFIKSDLSEVDRPTLRNGKILGIYAGARLETEEDYDINKATYGEEEFDRYSLAATINAVTFSPLGGANSMAFANTALDAHSEQPAYDENRLNTTFIPFSVDMTDREGQFRKEAVLALVAFDNLQDQVLIDYGDAYLNQFSKPHPSPIKQETDSD